MADDFLGVRLDPEVKGKLSRYAAVRGLKLSEVVRRALSEFAASLRPVDFREMPSNSPQDRRSLPQHYPDTPKE